MMLKNSARSNDQIARNVNTLGRAPRRAVYCQRKRWETRGTERPRNGKLAEFISMVCALVLSAQRSFRARSIVCYRLRIQLFVRLI